MPISKLLFSFQGRIGRQTFWITAISTLVIYLVAAFLIVGVGRADSPAFLLILSLLGAGCVWVLLAGQVKRWHDRDKSGWMVLINFIPIIGLLWPLVELGFLKGTGGSNRFGADPLQDSQQTMATEPA